MAIGYHYVPREGIQAESNDPYKSDDAAYETRIPDYIGNVNTRLASLASLMQAPYGTHTCNGCRQRGSIRANTVE